MRKSKRTKRTKRVSKTAGVRVTKSEVESLLQHSSGRIRVAILLAFHHGMRIQEVCNLLRDDVDLKNGTITIRHLKGSNTVHHKMSDDEVQAVTELLTSSPDSRYIFTSRKHDLGKAINPKTLFSEFVEVAKKAGLPAHKRHFHVLRHGLGFLMSENGCTVQTIQKALGHVSIAAAAIYSLPSQETVDRALASVLGN